MTGPEYEAELEAFLKRRSLMHRRLSDIDHAEPSSDLDRIVLNRAREAIETPSEPLLRSSRWALPIGLSAAILIAFTVVLNIEHQGGKGTVASNVSPAAEAQQIAPAVARAASVRESAGAEPRVLSDSPTGERRDQQPAAKTAEVPAPALANSDDVAEPHDVGSASADSARLVASRAAIRSTVEARVPAPAPASTPAEKVANPHATPDSWLREINRLRAAGKTADADRELAAFRAAYPTHPAYSVAKPPAR
jgi:hypothetical protein